MINSALSRSFMAMTVLLTSEQTRDKCLLKNFSIAKKGERRRCSRVKKGEEDVDTVLLKLLLFFSILGQTHIVLNHV